MTQLRDEELVAAMATNHPAALDEFYRRYAQPIMAILLRVLGSRADAEEKLQEVFVELWTRSGQYDPERGAVAAWVIQVSRCRAIDAQRARKRRRHDVQVRAEEELLCAPFHLRPDSQAVKRQEHRRVRLALASLTALQREALELAYFSGLSHSEIAEHIGVPLGTVKSRISAAMRRLRYLLSDGQVEGQAEPRWAA
jgi:RNA polymerase sigma-70 factor (ECF subfamily)